MFPDTYHPPFVTEVQLSIRRSNRLSHISYIKYSPGGLFVVIRHPIDLRLVFSLQWTSVNGAVDTVAVAVTQATETGVALCVISLRIF